MKKSILYVLGTALLYLTILMSAYAAPGSANSATPHVGIIDSVYYDTDNNNIVIYFSDTVGSDAALTALDYANVVHTDVSGAGVGGGLSDFSHTKGSDWAIIQMASGPGVSGDTADTITVNDIYTAGGKFVEEATYNLEAADTTAPTITVKKLKGGSANIYFEFSEPVINNSSGNTGPLYDVDENNFTYTDNGADNATAITSQAGSSADARSVALLANFSLDATNDIADAVEGVTPDTGEIFDLMGNALVGGTKIVLNTFTVDSAGPVISNVFTQAETDVVVVLFDEMIFVDASSATSPALNGTDFDLTSGARTIDSVDYGNGYDFVYVYLDDDSASLGTLDVATAAGGGAGAGIYDIFGNAATTGGPNITMIDNIKPTLDGVWINQIIEPVGKGFAEELTEIDSSSGISLALPFNTASFVLSSEGSASASMTISNATNAQGAGFMVPLGLDSGYDIYNVTNGEYEFTQVKFDVFYEDDTGAATLDADGDLVFVVNDASDYSTASQWNITTDIPHAGSVWTTVTVDLTAAVDAGTALANQVSTPNNWGIRLKDGVFTDLAVDDVIYIDNVKFSAAADSRTNLVVFEYSEPVKFASGDLTGGADDVVSTSSIGDTTTNKTFAGFGSFAAGTFSTPTATNYVYKSSSGMFYVVSLGGGDGGLITQASPVSLSGLFTPVATIQDNAGNAISTTSTRTASVTDAFDLTTSATAISNYTLSSSTAGTVQLGWSPSAQASTFAHYAILYGTSASVGVGDSLYDETDNVLLATATTDFVEISGLTETTEYFFNFVGVDNKGNATALASERSVTPSGATTSSFSDSTAPGLPTDLRAVVNEDLNVVLSWVDPTAFDLEGIYVAKEGDVVATVAPGVLTYTDEDVSEGQVVSYSLKSFDDNGNVSAFTSETTVTVEFITEEVTPEEPVESEEPLEPAVEPIIEEPIAEIPVDLPVVDLILSDLVEHWAKDIVKSLYEDGIINGVDGGEFFPDRSVTRAEILKIALGAFNHGLVDPNTYIGPTYSDVVLDEWYAKYALTAVESGIVSGYDDGTFRPGFTVTRAEALKIILNASGQEIVPTTFINFVDVSTLDWFYDFVSYAVGNDIVTGYADNFFRPHTNITRAEAAKIVELMRK